MNSLPVEDDNFVKVVPERITRVPELVQQQENIITRVADRLQKDLKKKQIKPSKPSTPNMYNEILNRD